MLSQLKLRDGITNLKTGSFIESIVPKSVHLCLIADNG